MTVQQETGRDPRVAAASVEGKPVDERRLARQFVGVRLALWRVVFVVILLALWQLCAGRLIDTFWISSPTQIGQRIGDWISDGTLVDQLAITLQEAAYGFVIGAALGALLGVILGQLPRLALIIDPVVYALYSLPRIALAPIFILWFGIGLSSKVFLSATAVFFLVFFNTYTGVRDVEQDLVDSVRIMGASRRALAMKVVLPSSLLWIFAGLKISVPYAIIGAVVGEMVASNRGIGYLMQYSAGQYDTTGVFVGLVVLAAVSMVLNEILRHAEKTLVRWKG